MLENVNTACFCVHKCSTPGQLPTGLSIFYVLPIEDFLPCISFTFKSVRVQAGIALIRAWFINGCSFDSEVWMKYSSQDLHDLEVIDDKIFCIITGAQQKAPAEMLFLETAELPIKHGITVRRIL